MPHINKIVFPVAGMGTRFLPATKVTPKEMLPIVDKPLIQYATEEAAQAGAKDLVFISNQHKHLISRHFENAFELETKLKANNKQAQLELTTSVLPDGLSMIAIPQPGALGLGHAVLCALPAVGNEPFGVILPDDLIYHETTGCMKQMVDLYEQHQCSIIAVEEVDPSETGKYGIVSTTRLEDGTERLEAIVEKPDPAVAPSNLAVVGRYILTPKIFELLRTTAPGAGGEIQLTDAISELIQHETILCHRFKGLRYDCGSKIGFVKATVEFAMRHPEIKSDTIEFIRSLNET